MNQANTEEMRVLRFFGSDDREREQGLKDLTQRENVQYEQARHGSEVLVALYSTGKNSTKLLDTVQQGMQCICGAALYAAGNCTLPMAALQALLEQDKLFVASERVTGALLEKYLKGQEGASSVYDFGQQSYANTQYAVKSGQQGTGDMPRQLRIALRFSGADFAVGAAPALGGGTSLFLGARSGFWKRNIPKEENPALWLLDMLRRAALGKAQASGTAWKMYADRGPQAGAEERLKMVGYSYLPPKSADRLGEENDIQRTAQRPTEEPAPAKQIERPESEEAPQHTASDGRHAILMTLLFVLVVAAVVMGALWLFTGGNPLSFLKLRVVPESAGNGASLI